jgi:hypothetical protein
MDEQVKPDKPEAPSPAAPEKGPAAQFSTGNNGEYRDRRRGWIREHASDDNFLIFLGVVFAVALLGLVGYKLAKELRRPAPLPPIAVSLADIFKAAKAVEDPPGTIALFYDFATLTGKGDPRDDCPQISDWFIPGGTVARVEGEGAAANSGVLVSGKFSRLKPYFIPGDLSVECDAGLLQGAEIILRLDSIEEGRVDDGYRFEVCASRAPGEPASAAIVEYRKGDRVNFSPTAKLPELLVRRKPPLFYRLKLALSGGMLRGYFQGQEVCQLPVGKVLPGTVVLLGSGQSAVFDNVTVVGRPHPDFVKPRVEMYRLFRLPAGADPENPPAPDK